VRNAMGNALSATRTSAPKHSFVSAMNATLGHTADDVLFVVLQVFLMLITVQNAPD